MRVQQQLKTQDIIQYNKNTKVVLRETKIDAKVNAKVRTNMGRK